MMALMQFSVPGMTCGHCVAAISGKLNDISGVSGVDVDLESKTVRVDGENLGESALREAIEEAGYEALPL